MTSFYHYTYRALFFAGTSALMFLLSSCGQAPEVKQTANSELRASCFDVVFEDSAVHLLYGEPAADKALNFYYSKRKGSDQSWPTSVQVPTVHAPPGNHHRGNDPQIAVEGDHLMALWTARGGGPFGSGPLAISLSSDGGKTWKPGPSPTLNADQTKEVGYRFPATAAGDGAFHVVWIHAEGQERSLRYSRLALDGTEWSTPAVIDSTSCACCWNELKITEDGKLFVLYRDEKPRDMAFAVSSDRGMTWNRTGPVGDFKWDLNGCPHVGGGLALSPGGSGTSANQLFATVWTGHTNHSGAYVLLSDDDGASWTAPMRLGASKTGRHTDTAALSSGTAAVAWDEPSTNGQAVFVALTDDGGKTWVKPKRMSTAKANYPRLVAGDNQFFILWSEDQEKEAPLLRMEVLDGDVRH